MNNTAISSFYYGFLVFLLMSFQSANGQFYERVYGGNPSVTPAFFHPMPDHGVVILGNKIDPALNTSGYYILRLDSNGNEIWHKEFIDLFNAYGESITTLKDGKIVILGTHTGILYQNVAEILVLDTNGNFLNYKSYPPFSGWGSSGVAMSNYGDSSVSISIYNDGFISNNYYSVFTLNSDLSIKWNDFVGFDGSFTNEHGLSCNRDGYVYTSAYYDDYPYSAISMQKVTSVKLHDNAGTLLLDSVYEFQCVTTGIESTRDGGALIFGIQDSSQQKDMVLIRIDSSGNVLWNRQYGSEFNEETKAIVETQDSGFALIASIFDPVIPKQHDLLLVKFNLNGDSLWSKKFGGTLDDVGLHIEIDSSDFIMLGSSTSFNDDHIYVIRSDSSGIIQSAYNIIPNGRYFCQGDTVILALNPAPGPGMSVVWSDSDSGYTDTIGVSGNYYAIITDSLGTSQRTPYIPVYFTMLPDVNIGPDTAGFCEGSILIDTGNTELTNTYHWYLDGIQLMDENTHSIIPQQAGYYQLVIGNYCISDTGSVLVDTIFRLPVPPVITAPPINYVCEGDSIQLSILPDSSQAYQWLTGNVFGVTPITGAIDTFYYANTYGDYLVKVTDVNGCSALSFPFTVSYDLEQVFVSINGPSGFCTGGEVVLSVGPGTDYTWSTGDSTQNITVDSTGDYFVSFINVNGCDKSSDTIAITVFDNPVVYIGTDTMLCSGASLLLDAGAGFSNYLWSDGSTVQTLLALPVGPFPDTTLYSVFVIDSNTCTDSDTLQIIFDLCSGLNQLSAYSAAVFPNPLKRGEPLRITSSLPGKNTLILMDVLNREVTRKEFISSAQIIETSEWIPGVYLYSVLNEDNNIITGKIIIN